MLRCFTLIGALAVLSGTASATPSGWSVDPAGFAIRTRLLNMSRARADSVDRPRGSRRPRTTSRLVTKATKGRRSSLSEKQLVVRTMRAEWDRLGVGPDQQAALLTIAWKESRMTLDSRSADGMPDARNGHSWGVFQMGKRTLGDLGVPIANLMVRRRADGSASSRDVVRAARASARAAVAYLMVKARRSGREPWLQHTLRRTGGRHDAVAREMFVVWSGGLSRRWADVVARARSHPHERHEVGSLGYIFTQVRSRLRLYLGVFRPAVLETSGRSYARR